MAKFFKALSKTFVVNLTVGDVEILNDTISPLNRSIIGDRYTFLSPTIYLKFSHIIKTP